MLFHPDSHTRDTSVGIGLSYDIKVPRTPENDTIRESKIYEQNKLLS